MSPSKRFQNISCSCTQAAAKTAGGHGHGLYFASGTFDVIVHNQTIVLGITLHFLASAVQPAINFLRRIQPAGAQSALKFLPRRRQDKYRDGAWQSLPYR